MPIAAAAPGAAPVYRANMMRGGLAATPAAAPGRARASRPRAGGPPKARAVRKAAAHRSARKAGAGRRRLAVAAPARAPALRRPTPMLAAARDLATPVAYALIATTICEAGPAAAAPAPPDGASGLPGDGVIPAADMETVLPPILGPGFLGLEPSFGDPGGEPPVIAPPIPPPPLAPVPEPGTWALMILGFGLMGARLRRAGQGCRRSGSPPRIP
ncbi:MULTISPECIES: PEPxxWA-CTERM sorting domain-containing protein [unclassified Phenylobacterium]|uniref:PEPxxWA-CTERM sorting domain-containing protein n=1 Tax=unclassified Phenylobacterium TaxID=2640670 RepID=UPI00083B20C0|nr:MULTISPECIES: PEPxxWA-CTERM sorting domain-containing protein [unclassified Phenylobacterium]